MTNPNPKTWIILERVFDETGDYIDNKEIYRGLKKPTHKLNQNQGLFSEQKSNFQYDHRLGFPAAHGLSNRRGI
jgi:hypothetical protein